MTRILPSDCWAKPLTWLPKTELFFAANDVSRTPGEFATANCSVAALSPSPAIMVDATASSLNDHAFLRFQDITLRAYKPAFW
jgi:hypothetical protein